MSDIKNIYLHIMICFHHLLPAILLLQAPYALCNFYETIEDDTAKVALEEFSNEIESATKLISTEIPNLWEGYIQYAEEIEHDDLNYLLSNFTLLLINITEIGKNVTGIEECTIVVKQTLLQRLSDINDTETTSQEDIFVNLQSLANTDLTKISRQLKYLQAEYEASCGDTKVNCDGTTKSIVAEVERLIPVTQRAAYGFLAETIVLGYELVVESKSLYSYLANHFDSSIQNITACIASKLDQSTLELTSTIPSQPNVRGSILESFTDLLFVSENAMLHSVTDLLSLVTDLIKRCYAEYLTTIANIRDVISIANKTTNTIYNILPDLNATVNCELPNFLSALNFSISRALEEYTEAIESMSQVYERGLDNLNVTLQEVSSISLQVGGCSGTTTCDYLVEKIDRKTKEIPLEITSLGNSTAVLIHQSVSLVWKSRYNIVNDVMEQLEGGIIRLKSCLKTNLYKA